MRWGLLGVRLLMLSLNIAIVIIILFSLLPLVQGDISVEIPDSGAGPTFSDGVLTIFQPVQIQNGGYYDIQDFSASLLMTDNGTLIAEQQTIPEDIPAGQTKMVNVEFNINVDDLSEEARSRLIFNSTNLDINIGVHVAYTLGLVKLDLRGNQTMLNEPILSSISLDVNNVSLVPSGTSIAVSIPYSFAAASFVQGLPLSVHASVANDTASLGNGSQDIVVSENNNGQMIVTLDGEAAAWLRTHSEDLTFTLSFEFFGAMLTNNYHYSWNVGAI